MLFCNSVTDAKASANLYSLISIDKASDIELYSYSRKFFTELPDANSLEGVDALLPFKLKSAYDNVYFIN